MRAPLRPGGQSEQVLRTLERMRNAQRVAEEEDEKAYRFRLSPVAAGIADKTGVATALITAAVVGGAMFGDNLSFISDTTIVATRLA